MLLAAEADIAVRRMDAPRRYRTNDPHCTAACDRHADQYACPSSQHVCYAWQALSSSRSEYSTPSCQIILLRFTQAIDEIALLAHSSGLWQKRCAHITLLQASLHHSLLDFNTARRLYAVAAKLFQADTQLNMVCRASEIFVRLASLDDGNDGTLASSSSEHS